ncbi:MAG: extracellular solute-binding protein [Spirochaetales bacterium]|nr:extracellular solute-binding protein [Spirochaetales bacterium]
MKKRIGIAVLLICVFLIVSVLFVGCKKKEEGPVTVSWWLLSGGGGADDPRDALNRKIAADFMAANPNVTIEMTILENEAFKQKIKAAIDAGDPPDIFHSWGGGVMVDYANKGMLRDVTSFVKDKLAKKVGIGALGVYGYDGKYYGSPYDMGGVVFWYNKDMFTKAGVSVPQTYDDLLAAVPKFKAMGKVPIALGAGDKWPAHFWWVYLAMRIGGIDAFNAAYGGAGSFKDATFVKAGEMLLKLAALEPFQPGFLGATYDDQARLVGNGTAAMELMGQWAPAVESGNAGDNYIGADKVGIFTFPAVADGKGALTDVMGGGNGYVFGKGAPDAALDFLDFYLSMEYQKEKVDIEGIIPVVKGAETALQGNAAEIAKAVGNAGYYQLYYDQFLPPAVGEAVKNAVANLLAGTATPESVAAMIDDAWQMEK